MNHISNGLDRLAAFGERSVALPDPPMVWAS